MHWGRLALALTCLGAGGGCASPDLRTAAYLHIGPEAVVVQPAHRIPAKGTLNYALNDVRFIPGALVAPYRRLERDDWGLKAEQWFSNRPYYCPPPSSLYKIDDIEVPALLPDIVIDYDFDASPSAWLGRLLSLKLGTTSAADERARASRDLGLRPNELRYLRQVKIEIRNRRLFAADPGQLDRARTHILAQCPRLKRDGRQVIAAYSGDLDVEVAKDAGAAIDAGVVAAKIRRYLAFQQSGRDLIIFIMARPASGT